MVPTHLHLGFPTSEYIIPPDRLDGGLATYIQKVGRALVNRGHHVSVFCLSERDSDWLDQGVHVYEIRAEPRGALPGPSRILRPVLELGRIIENSTRLATRLLEVNREQPFDVVQAAPNHAVAMALCHNGRFPLISRVSSASRLWRRAHGQANTPSAVVTDWCEAYQLEHSDATFSPSELMAKYYSRSYTANPRLLRTPVEVQMPAWDDSFYQGHLGGKKYILYSGDLNRVKGIEVISAVVGPLLEEFPEVHFVFIGRPYTAKNGHSYVDNLMRANEKWRKNLHYFASLPKNQLFPVVRNAYGVLLPSLIDNYPNTCLEAMQFGRIVVGTRDTSIDEMIVDGETGILVEKGSADSLQAGIRRLLELSPAAKQAMEQRVQEAFQAIAAEDRLGQLIEFYHATIEAFNSARNQRQMGSKQVLRPPSPKSQLWVGVLGEGVNNAARAFENLRNSLLGKPNLS